MEYVRKNTHLFGYRCWPNRKRNCASEALVSRGLLVSLESRVLCWRDACDFYQSPASWAWQHSTFLTFIAGNNVLYYQHMTLVSHLFRYFFQCLQKHICIYFIRTSLSVSVTSLYMFRHTRGKVMYYESLQKEKAHDTGSSRVDAPVWHIYKAQEK